MNRASYAAFSATTIAALVLAACTPASTPAPATAETVRIYSSLPLTGSSAGQTTTIVNAINLAIKQQTQNKLVCDSKIKIG